MYPLLADLIEANAKDLRHVLREIFLKSVGIIVPGLGMAITD
jgi:hypothetical protein